VNKKMVKPSEGKLTPPSPQVFMITHIKLHDFFIPPFVLQKFPKHYHFIVYQNLLPRGIGCFHFGLLVLSTPQISTF